MVIYNCMKLKLWKKYCRLIVLCVSLKWNREVSTGTILVFRICQTILIFRHKDYDGYSEKKYFSFDACHIFHLILLQMCNNRIGVSIRLSIHQLIPLSQAQNLENQNRTVGREKTAISRVANGHGLQICHVWVRVTVRLSSTWPLSISSFSKIIHLIWGRMTRERKIF